MRNLYLTFWLALGLACGCGAEKADAQNPASLEGLNCALAVVVMRRGSFPPSANDLAAFLAISGQTMPVSPPGKRLVLDPSQRQFILVDQ